MEYNKLYEKIIYNISKTIKRTLNEEIQSFDVTDYNDESDIIDAQTSDKLTMICPKTNGEFYDLVVQRIAKNPSNPYLQDINTINVTDMSNLFYNGDKFYNNMERYYYRYGVTPKNIKKLDLSNWNTSNVIDMRKMFKNCSSLEELNLSGFDTTNVQTMEQMFLECRQLTELDISDFDTTNVRTMSEMFSGCSNLTKLDVSSFDTSNVKDMRKMFYDCKQLTELDVSGFNTSNVVSMNRMFTSCEKLQKLDVSNFVTTNFSDAGFSEAFSYMFAGCKSLTELDIYKFSIPSGLHDFKAIQGIFAGCDSLKYVTLPAKFIKQTLNIALGLPMNIKIQKRKKKVDNYQNEDE